MDVTTQDYAKIQIQMKCTFIHTVNLPATLSSTCRSPSSEYRAKSRESKVCTLDVLAVKYTVHSKAHRTFNEKNDDDDEIIIIIIIIVMKTMMITMCL